MKLLLIRHGQTDWNMLWRMQGSVNTDINDCGIRQARIKAGFLRKFHIDYVFSSPLKRAVHTASIVMKPCCPYETDFRLNEIVCENGINPDTVIRDCRNIYTDPRLSELCFGINEGRFPSERTPDVYYFFNEPDKYTAPEGAETLEAFRDRVNSFISEVLVPLSLREPDATVMISGHGALNKCISMCLCNKEIADFWSGSHIHNLSHAIFEINGKKFTEIQDFTD